MEVVLKEAGVSFLRAFAGALLVLIPGILAAPDLREATAMAWAASAASVIAGIKALQVFAPELQVGYLLTKLLGLKNAPLEVIEDSFARAFVGTFLTLIIGVFAAPDLGLAKTAAIAALVGAFTAAIRTVQGAFTPGEAPVPEKGVKPKVARRKHAATQTVHATRRPALSS
jgi:hypothetical protein